MPFSFINTVASWMLKKRIHQIELFVKYPVDVQNDELKKLIQIAKNTEIGKKYDFSTINNYKTFSERVPSVTYEEFFPTIKKTIDGEQNIFGLRILNGLLNQAELLTLKVNFFQLVIHR